MESKRFEGFISDEILECVFEHLDDPLDRSAVSQVCRQWHNTDAQTRKHVTVVSSYSVNPSVLVKRFRNLKSFKIKGKPRPYDFDLIVRNWGGYVGPWISELVRARKQYGAFPALQSIHLRRMEVTDEDLDDLAGAFANSLQSLTLDKCAGLTTNGLYAITSKCRGLKKLYLEESAIEDKGDEWLKELACHNFHIEVLNFSLTALEVEMEDLATLLRNCKLLTSLKVCEINAGKMRGALKSAQSLKELAVSYPADDHLNIDVHIELPRTLTSFSGDIPLPLDSHVASNLIQLNLMSTFTTLNAEAHSEVFKSCPNLEVLKVRNIIGDAGLHVLGDCCKKLKSIRIENLEDHHGFVSQIGMTYLAKSCVNLQFVAVYVSDITNSTLSAFGDACPNLTDFRIVLLETNEHITELPVDDGVRDLLSGCQKLERFAIYLRHRKLTNQGFVRHGGLTNQGLAHIGRYGGKLKWILLGCVGEDSEGFKYLSGCQKLQKLEIRDCPVSEAGIAATVSRIPSLRYVWAQGYIERNREDLVAMGPGWNIEYSPKMQRDSQELPFQFVAYRSLAGPRADHPPDVIQICPKTRYLRDLEVTRCIFVSHA